MFAILKRIAAAAVAASVLVPAAALGARAETFFTIGTGGVSGVYYPTGGAICRLVNQGRKETGMGCSVETTGGSVYNIETIRSGGLAFGIAQSDTQAFAYEGTDRFTDKGPFTDLRSVFSLYPEAFTVVARADSGIHSFDDLKGKRVNIGNAGSGQRTTFEVVLAAKGWTDKDFALASELKATEQSAALCDGQIDAMVAVVGHPAGSIQQATTACDSVLVPVTGPEIDKLVSDNSFYRKAVIPGGMYRGTDAPVETFGVGATLVTSAQVPDETVYQVVRAVFENFDAFKALHPAFATLDKSEMVSAALTAPLHPGAERYFREAGLLN